MRSQTAWSRPYYGVQHRGEGSTSRPWATVLDYGSFATFLGWFPGCQFHPEKRDFDTAAAAREAAERWLRDRNAL